MSITEEKSSIEGIFLTNFQLYYVSNGTWSIQNNKRYLQ